MPSRSQVAGFMTVVAGFHIPIVLVWWLVTLQQWEVHNKDWYMLHSAAVRFFNGQAIYPPLLNQQDNQWMWPPYALIPFLPLRYVGERASFMLQSVVQLGALAGSLMLLRAHWPGDRPTWQALLAGLLGSACFAFQLVLVQTAPTFLLAFCAAAVLLARGQLVAAGVVLSVVSIKPHWVLVPVLLFGLVYRRALVAMALTGVGFVLVSLVLGPQLWVDFFATATAQVDYAANRLIAVRNVTVRGLMVGLTDSQLVRNLGWGGLWVVGFPAWVYVIRSPKSDAWTRIAATVAWTLAAQVYINTYDALVALVPAVHLACDGRWRSQTRTVLTALLVLVWLWDLRVYLWPILLSHWGIHSGPFSLVGLWCSAWVFGLAWDYARREPLPAPPLAIPPLPAVS